MLRVELSKSDQDGSAKRRETNESAVSERSPWSDKSQVATKAQQMLEMMYIVAKVDPRCWYKCITPPPVATRTARRSKSAEYATRRHLGLLDDLLDAVPTAKGAKGQR